MSDVEKIIAEVWHHVSRPLIDGDNKVHWMTGDRRAKQLLSALRAAGYEVEKPEWEYRAKVEQSGDDRSHLIVNSYVSKQQPFTAEEMLHPVVVDEMSGSNALEGCYLVGQVRRRKAGVWQPVEGEA